MPLLTVKFLVLCGGDVRCRCCGEVYRAVMESAAPRKTCGRCMSLAFPAAMREKPDNLSMEFEILDLGMEGQVA